MGLLFCKVWSGKYSQIRCLLNRDPQEVNKLAEDVCGRRLAGKGSKCKGPGVNLAYLRSFEGSWEHRYI